LGCKLSHIKKISSTCNFLLETFNGICNIRYPDVDVFLVGRVLPLLKEGLEDSSHL